MGMDVYGSNPVSERGKYFRCTVWWWRPLWNYVCSIFPKAVDVTGQYNNGDGLDEIDAGRLAQILERELETGKTDEYIKRYKKFQDNLPDEDCTICAGTGKYQPQPEMEIANKIIEAITNEKAEESETCNACKGTGRREAWAKHYPMDLKVVRDFKEFVQDSGGFRIC